MNRFMLCAAMLWLGIGVLAGCKHEKVCTPGDNQTCYCPEGTVTEQTCRADGRGWGACRCTYYSAWCDDNTGLCWQDPQKDGYDVNEGGVVPADAIRYCQEVNFGGYSDWRAPTIDELRTLIRGDAGTVTGGACPLHDSGSVSADMLNPACLNLAEYGGPGTGTGQGCYWQPDLHGTCNKPDPGEQGHVLEYGSSTVCPDDPTKGWYGVVLFDNGAVCWNHIETFVDVRCVRDAPTCKKTCVERGACVPGETRQCTADNSKTGAQVCAPEGNCWGPCESTAFTKSPPPTDVCDQCDQLNLTIHVPVKLTVPYGQIYAFYYTAAGWSFPPARPPDGGNSSDQVLNPVIDIDKPFTLNVPGCTYYRTQCLSGDYMLFVALMQSSDIPPVFQEGDYWWGATAEQPQPITLGGSPVWTKDKDITLVPWVAP